MKIKNIILLIGIIGFTFPTIGQEKITKSFSTEDGIKKVIISNINGNVSTQGTKGDKITITGSKVNWGKSADVSFEFEQKGDILIAYVKTPCNYLDLDNLLNEKESWKFFNWKNNCDWEDGMSYEIDITLLVPEDMEIYLSTINNGDIDVNDINGVLTATNVNGAIHLENVKKVKRAKTVNGDVDINFSALPSIPGNFYTLNGDINANFPKNLSADMTFKSFNGDFFTNIEEVEMMPAQIKKLKHKKGTKYKNEGSVIKVGKGGVKLDFETFNGDAIVKVKS